MNMTTIDNKQKLILAQEAFIRRASIIAMPFMLKGSFVTRQYFKNPNDRIPADLDWVYLEKLNSETDARQVFNKWATLITALELDDNVEFVSFKENEFWRMIDYAMADDFPTVNTDIDCFVYGKNCSFCVDISFNLAIEQPPISLMYQPLSGKQFVIQHTVPLCLQVSWKIHQTLVRPRFKDIFDLMYLVQHESFNSETLELSFQALLNECKADNVDLNKLKFFLNYEFNKLFSDYSMKECWDFWRHGVKKNKYMGGVYYYDNASDIINPDLLLPKELNVFLTRFENILSQKGFKIDLLKDIDIPPLVEIEKVEEKEKTSLWEKIKNHFKN